jgi:hypothetical protein
MSFPLVHDSRQLHTVSVQVPQILIYETYTPPKLYEEFILSYCIQQSIQCRHAFFQVDRIGSPHPLTRKGVAPPLWIQGERHTQALKAYYNPSTLTTYIWGQGKGAHDEKHNAAECICRLVLRRLDIWIVFYIMCFLWCWLSACLSAAFCPLPQNIRNSSTFSRPVAPKGLREVWEKLSLYSQFRDGCSINMF